MEKLCKRLIEVDLPIKRISENARKEKSVRQGHISSLHIWWARRPLAACRAVLCSALWPDPADILCLDSFKVISRKEMQKWAKKHINLLSVNSYKRFVSYQTNPELLLDNIQLRFALLDFIADFSSWENSTKVEFIETSRILTEAAYAAIGGEEGNTPVIMDPFAGGGAFPLESLRIGAYTFASDINPLATLLNKITIEYIPRWGKELIKEVEKWGNEIKNEANVRLSKYYPPDSNGASPIGYLWARTIKCEGPACGVEVPIIKNKIISSRQGHEVAIKIIYNNKNLITKIVHGVDALKENGGTSKRSSVTCPACGFTTSRKQVEYQAKQRGFGFVLFCIALRLPNGTRIYRNPSSVDHSVLELANEKLEKWKDKTFFGIPAIPDEELPYLRSIFNVRVYGIDRGLY